MINKLRTARAAIRVARASLVIVAALAASGAWAQAVTLEPVSRHAGAGTGKVLSEHDTANGVAAAVQACIASAPAGASFTCKVQGTKAIDAPPLPDPAPIPDPAPPTPPPPPPPPSASVTYYFSDCQAGAAVGCVAGNNGNAGTSSTSPKQTLLGFDIAALPAGAHVLFARGGAWSNVNISVLNLNATPTAPVVFDSYATSWVGATKPLLMTSAANGVSFGNYGDTVQDGGYTFRNLKFDGQGTATWGFFLMGATRNVLIENNEITGFEIGTHFQNMASGNEALVIRGNHIHHNREMGMLGDANNMTIEGNTIEANNYSGSGFNHGLYLGGHATNGIVRNNHFINNSAVNGVCTGGNLTVHGQWTGLLIEGNVITQDASTTGCWGISLTDGYPSTEFFRNVTIRSNEIVNVELGIAARAAPDVLIEANVIRSNQPRLPSGIVIAPPNGIEDDDSTGARLVDNVVCFTAPNPGREQAVRLNNTRSTERGTVYRTGADSTTGACAITRSQ